jgi:uncharacterized membrane protein YeiH
MFDLIVFWLDWFGVAVFATTGALVASRKQMDLIGFILLGTVTGIGGGTIRDALLGNLPVFWIADPRYLITCVAVSSAAFFLAHIPQSRHALLLQFDAVGLSIFTVVGAETALAAGAQPIVAVAMGVITATFGGIIRDILGGESPAILRREIYVTAALLGATLFVVFLVAGIGRSGSLFAGFSAALVLRLGALRWQWTLPRYRPRPGRPMQ